MDPTKDIEPVTTLKRDAAKLIERARARKSPIVITQNGRATAVLQDVDSYERQRRALALLKLLAKGVQDYEEGRVVTNEQARKRVATLLEKLRKEET